MVSAIVLAAGESKRMGTPKQLLPIGDSTILEHVIGNLLGSKLSEVIVVLGYEADKIKAKIAAKPVRIVLNPLYQQGMSTSILAGLKAVAEGTQSIMFVLGDQPFIDSQTIDRLLEELSKTEKGIAVPVFQGVRGHPVLLSMKYRDELLKLRGDTGAREVISIHPDDVLEVAVDSAAVCRDIDTPGDYSSCLT